MDCERYQTVAECLWPSVRRAFNYPLLRGVKVVATDETVDPATFRWEDEHIILSATHLNALDPDKEELEWLVEILLKHEVGHYAMFPRELSRHLRCLERAEKTFGEDIGYRFYTLYADVCNELRLLQSRIGGEEVLRYRERVLKMGGSDDDRSSVARESHRRVQRLVVALYGEAFNDLEAAFTLPAKEQTYLDRLLEIDYLTDDPNRHERNLVRFGRTLEQALSDLPDTALMGIGSPEDHGKGVHERPFSGNEPQRIPEADLNHALSDALSEDQWTYERLKRFLERRADFKDPYDMEQGGAAGLNRGDIERHDDQVGFYRRWAAGFPLYVTDTPVEMDETALYRSGRRSYEMGDPISQVNFFASLGLFGVPGVSKVNEFEEGVAPAEKYGVPNLLLGIDSSASMPHPGDGSHAILAAFILAANYHRNGAKVGGYNFSGGVAFLSPSRDLDDLHSLLCARWGGGTVLDRDALSQFVRTADELEGITFSDEAAYEEILARELRDKEATTSNNIAKLFDGLDHVLITDGDLANEEAFISFIKQTCEYTRTFLLLTDESNYERWTERNLPNTWVYGVAEESDWLNQVIGLTKDRVSRSKRPTDQPEDTRK